MQRVASLLNSEFTWAILLLLVCLSYVTVPIWKRQYSYTELLLARLAWSFLPLPIIVILLHSSQTFRSFAAARFAVFFKGQNRTPVIVFWLVLFTLMFLPNVTSTYASNTSQCLGTVYYVTDRNPVNSDGNRPFSFEPSEDQLFYGSATVAVPWQARVSPVQFPLATLFIKAEKNRLEPTVLGSSALSRQDFFQVVRDASQTSPKRDAFVFIHGFRTTFDAALGEARKLAYDLKFKGAPILFSWPSGNDVTSYDHDSDHATDSVEHLSGFLSLLSSAELKETHLIAHSMGSRVLGGAVHLMMLLHTVRKGMFRNLVFAAPDVDPNTFKRYSAAITMAAQRTTVYVSSWDFALHGSSIVHKGDRVGLITEAHAGMDVIDTMGLDTSHVRSLGHSYIFDSQTLLDDLFALVNDGRAPDDRVSLRPSSNGTWHFEHR